jgi:hypothetical protein
MERFLPGFFDELEKIALYAIPRGASADTFIDKAVKSTLAKGGKDRVRQFGGKAHKIYQNMLHKGYADPAVELAAKRFMN